MKRGIMLLFAALGLLCSCQSAGDHYYAFKESSGGKWGMISPSGQVLFEGEFKEQPTHAVGGVFFSRTGKNNLWQMYEASSRPSTVSDDTFRDIFLFTEKVTLAAKPDGPFVIIDKKGNTVATLEKVGNVPIDYVEPFHEGLAVIGTASGYGAVNTNGEVVVKPKFYALRPYSDQVAIGIENKYKDNIKNGEEDEVVYSVIDTKGKTILSFKHSKYPNNKGEFHSGLLAVCKKDNNEARWGFIIKKGEEVVKPTAKNAQIGEWNDAVYVFSDGEQVGLKSMTNDEVLIRCKYDKLFFADNEGSLLWACEESGNGETKCTLVNRKGEVISKDTYKGAMSFYNGADYCPVMVSAGEWTFINKKGEEQKLTTDVYSIGTNNVEEAIFSERLRHAMNSRSWWEHPSVTEILEDFAEEITNEIADVAEAATKTIDAIVNNVATEGKVYANAYDGYVNIRNSASDKGIILGRFENGPDGAIKLGEENGWIQIDCDGVVGYVYAKYVSSRPTSPVYTTVDGKWLKGQWTDGSTTYNLAANGTFVVTHPNGDKDNGVWRLEEYDIVLQTNYGSGGSETKKLYIDEDNKRIGDLIKQ